MWPGPMNQPSRASSDELTPREREVLTWVARGKAAREIAVILGITKRTVDEHMATIRRKLHAASGAQAVAIAVRNGLI